MAVYVEINPEFQEKKMKEQQDELTAAAAANTTVASSTPHPSSAVDLPAISDSNIVSPQ
jgi:hypothetical protein